MVQVHLDLSEPQQHLVAVQIQVAPRLARMRLALPGWTPGSYLMRDYVRQLEGLVVEQGSQVLELQRLEPSAWGVESDPSGGLLTIRYRVLATELTVRTCHLDHEHGFLALAAVVLELEGERWSPHQLSCTLPHGWQAFVPLPCSNGVWQARDLDHLLDTPLEAGPHRPYDFAVHGVPHQLVCWAGVPGEERWLLERQPTLLDDLRRVCEACCRLMGVASPAAHSYLVILHLVDEGYGGLEHDDSTVLVYGRRNFEKPNGYRRFLQLVAHEYLHQWNVRRLRPAELTPIDYHRPPVVPTLWFAEGVTSYLDQFLPLSAGLSDPEDLFTDLGEDLSRYRLTPGRGVQSLRESSQEAWVKLYKADAYSADAQVSYYLKGAVVALCLDLHLRRNGGSLMEVLRQLWLSHGRWGRGYSEADLVQAFATHAPDLATQLPRWLRELDDPDLDGYLSSVGLFLDAEMASTPWAGLTPRQEDGGLLAARVVRGGPAEQAGVMVGDELVALDQQRLKSPDDLQRSLRPDHAQTLLIARRSKLRSLELLPQAPQVERYQLKRVADATDAQLAAQQRWLLQQPAQVS
ncbi:MAG: M61 family metallopeptidase [Cyanobacteria bacterium K_DeepCast_35m_m1_288]|nr:M61 family metallopeptidase [Cyanobacteria bacterium K_DeepCast_35m_m1_288]